MIDGFMGGVIEGSDWRQRQAANDLDLQERALKLQQLRQGVQAQQDALNAMGGAAASAYANANGTGSSSGADGDTPPTTVPQSTGARVAPPLPPPDLANSVAASGGRGTNAQLPTASQPGTPPSAPPPDVAAPPAPVQPTPLTPQVQPAGPTPAALAAQGPVAGPAASAATPPPVEQDTAVVKAKKLVGSDMGNTPLPDLNSTFQQAHDSLMKAGKYAAAEKVRNDWADALKQRSDDANRVWSDTVAKMKAGLDKDKLQSMDEEEHQQHALNMQGLALQGQHAQMQGFLSAVTMLDVPGAQKSAIDALNNSDSYFPGAQIASVRQVVTDPQTGKPLAEPVTVGLDANGKIAKDKNGQVVAWSASQIANLQQRMLMLQGQNPTEILTLKPGEQAFQVNKFSGATRPVAGAPNQFTPEQVIKNKNDAMDLVNQGAFGMGKDVEGKITGHAKPEDASAIAVAGAALNRRIDAGEPPGVVATDLIQRVSRWRAAMQANGGKKVDPGPFINGSPTRQ